VILAGAHLGGVTLRVWDFANMLNFCFEWKKTQIGDQHMVHGTIQHM